MAWIHIIPPEEAEGPLAAEYAAAEARAGRVWNIVAVMSQNPRAMKASMGLYLALMYGPSPLSRARREMLAVVVSAANRCHY
jgi:alkylhydroperoxidase family enzyme